MSAVDMKQWKIMLNKEKEEKGRGLKKN